MRHSNRIAAVGVLLCLLGTLSAGCNNGPSATSAGATQTAEGIQKQIDAINANAAMPQQAKDAAIAQLQGAKAQSEAAARQSAAQAGAQKAAKQ